MKKVFLLCIISIRVGVMSVYSQGTIQFNNQPINGGLDYYEQGMGFHVIVPTLGHGSPNHDTMGMWPANVHANIPYNPTTYLGFIQQFSPDDYVTFSLMSGALFGLSLVELADAMSPSPRNLPIEFIGTKSDGSLVHQTFITPGGGANTLQKYYFDSDFTWGLVSVDIQAPCWAMDNLVFIPEPSTTALIGFGLLAGWRTLRKRRLL